jgi:hypothetical protein
MLAILPHQGKQIIVEWEHLRIRAHVIDCSDPECDENGIGGWIVEIVEFLDGSPGRAICGVQPKLGEAAFVSIADSPTKVMGNDGAVIWERDLTDEERTS